MTAHRNQSNRLSNSSQETSDAGINQHAMPGTLQRETVATIRAVAAADPYSTPELVERIVQACTQPRPRRRLGTKHDAAAILGCHAESVKRYARRGLLHPVRITARRVRYDLDEVIRFADHGANSVSDGKAA
jgi:hypothetical protein